VKIFVRAIRPHTGGGCLLALADVQVGPFLLRCCRIVQQPGQRPWAQLPQQPGQNGRWFPALSCCDRDLDGAIKNAILDSWHNFLEGGAQ
jgi:hypothetical protein